MIKHSFKIKLTVIMALLVTTVIGIICLLGSTLFVKYYYNKKTNSLKESYNKVSKLVQSEFPEDMDTPYDFEKNESAREFNKIIRNICYHYGISLVVLNSNWMSVYSSQMDATDIIRRYQDLIFGSVNNKKIIEKNSNYTISKCYDKLSSMSFLEIHGILENEYHIIMQLNIESIESNIRSFTDFILIAGVAILFLSIIIVYAIASGVTKPVLQLSKIATRMSDMKFDVKYQGKTKDEIGQLGNSINIMSENLEKTISELKTANLELRNDIQIITQADEKRREFLSDVTHELKTPIALIQGYAEGLKEGISDDPESREFYCDVIIDEANKMNVMVKKLLTLNQIECGTEMPEVKRFDITELVDSVAKANQLIMEKNDIRLCMDYDSVPEVWADDNMIEEVFTNYMSNAISHCEKNSNGDKIITISITALPDKFVRVEVGNTGKQIPESDISRIWEKFYKVDKARTREYGGNGIGLSIVKAILEKHNATYGAKNISDGVVFWFELPCL